METIPWMTVLLLMNLGADMPPPPVLKLDPLSQGSITEKKFHFYKDGVEITSSEEGLLEPSMNPQILFKMPL
ncbi:hypothetical protein E2320_002861 [Naja naja]|nr:hypothetical protein E2320_002861 [Naja naja]